MITLDNITEENKRLEEYFIDKLEVNHDLKRTLVSFQANKKTPGYRWYKFKEGYSSELVKYVFSKLNIKKGKLIDPFTGSGTSQFVSSELGLDSMGIELLPIGVDIVNTRKFIFNGNQGDIVEFLTKFNEGKPWLDAKKSTPLNYLRITDGAFPKKTEELIGKYLYTIGQKENKEYENILRFALLCILESISYTRKDGQYLRWDYRAGKNGGKSTFDKGKIEEFNVAITNKIQEIINDLHENSALFNFNKNATNKGKIELKQGSCLTVLPTLESNSFDVLMTSPPYCNRYDYTRTYALELALLGVDEEKIRQLRQDMMSCTVENREKENLNGVFSSSIYSEAKQAFDNQIALQNIIKYLYEKKESKELNNPGIARMVKNYFFEITLIIFECARVLKKNSYFVMVNDNVRYAGANIPVDLILSNIAEKAGFIVEKIWVLPVGKGNSSQQMGVHGREELRKCVYVWKKL